MPNKIKEYSKWVQLVEPNVLLKSNSYRGQCLKFVDDAINAPSRTPTARQAYENELRAGRISMGELPLNVWVIIFFSFQVGKYAEDGHVALAKRMENGMMIYDSDYASGTRKRPYGSINEVLNWFNIYSPKYLGYSVACDGRQIAKEEHYKKEEEMITKTMVNTASRFILGRPATEEFYNRFVGKPGNYDDVEAIFRSSDEFKQRIKDAKEGKLNPVENMPVELREAYKAKDPNKANVALDKIKNIIKDIQ
jgi:hypothetical protein|nr:MAG TPA: hypothetical protein [Caudoviricetes sp.]